MITALELTSHGRRMRQTPGPSSGRRWARLCRFPKSVVCIIATSGGRHESAPPAVMPGSFLPSGRSRSQSTLLTALLPTPVQALLAFLGLSRERRPSSTESDEVLAKDNVIQTLTADRADEALHEWVLPRALRRGEDLFDPHALQTVPELPTVDLVTITEEIGRRTRPERRPRFAGRSSGRWGTR